MVTFIFGKGKKSPSDFILISEKCTNIELQKIKMAKVNLQKVGHTSNVPLNMWRLPGDSTLLHHSLLIQVSLTTTLPSCYIS